MDQRVRFRANRTLSRHRRMTESDPSETWAAIVAVHNAIQEVETATVEAAQSAVQIS
jgi:hypothetical protein